MAEGETDLNSQEGSAHGMIDRIMAKVEQVTYPDAVDAVTGWVNQEIGYTKTLANLIRGTGGDSTLLDNSLTTLTEVNGALATGDTKPARAYLSGKLSFVIGRDPIANRNETIVDTLVDEAAKVLSCSLALNKGPAN